MGITRKVVNRRAWLAGVISLSSLPFSACLKTPLKRATTTATDFSRSFCYYIPKNQKIWVRIQIECRCQIFDRSSGRSDEYFLTVRTQTGLRTDPPSDHRDPGYDFWMIFSKKHVLIRRVHTSSYNLNPSRPGVDRFHSSGWRLQSSPARLLSSRKEIREAVQSWRPLVAVSEFVGEDPSRGYRIEYPVKWADGNPDDTFRVETGPVVLLDPDRAEVGRSLEFDDFQWAYLDYRSFDRVRCFLEKPTSILSGATYRPPDHLPRRYPALTGRAGRPNPQAPLQRMETAPALRPIAQAVSDRSPFSCGSSTGIHHPLRPRFTARWNDGAWHGSSPNRRDCILRGVHP